MGAGITGLSAARELKRLGYAVEVYEASSSIGGLAKTFKDNQGFIYDNGPRFIFSTLAEKIGILDECVPVKYFEHLFVGGRYYLFPFGFVRNPGFLISVGSAFITRYFSRRPRTLGEFLRLYYGRYFSRSVLAPLIEKWCGRPCDEMSIDFASRLLPTNLSYIVYSLIKKLRGGITEDYYKKGRYIVYPKASNARIFEALSAGLDIRLDAPLKKMTVQGDTVSSIEVSTLGEIKADAFLSTIPVHALANALSTSEPLAHLRELSYRAIVILFIKLNKPKLLEGLWTWFPEKKYPFYRISEYKNAVPGLAPPDRTLVSVELACKEGDEVWRMDQDELLEYLMPYLKELYGLSSADVLGLDKNACAHAYPVLEKSTEAIQRRLTHATPLKNLFLAGRTGQFQYRMTEGCYDSALEAVHEIHAYLTGETHKPMVRAIETDTYGRPLVVHE